jgi:hypothetical protein
MKHGCNTDKTEEKKTGQGWVFLISWLIRVAAVLHPWL